MNNEVITIITSVGFPIFACCALGWYVYKVQTEQNKVINDLKVVIEKQNENNEKIKECLFMIVEKMKEG